MFMMEADGNTDNSSNLLNLDKLDKFRMTMEDRLKYKQSTIKEKLRRILLAIKYTIRKVDNQGLYYKGKRVLTS